MQIVIELEETIYNRIKDKHETIWMSDADAIWDSVVNGVLLPKGHGKLKDVDALYENTEIGHDEDGYACVTWKEINDAPTIIEADKEGEDEVSN